MPLFDSIQLKESTEVVEKVKRGHAQLFVTYSKSKKNEPDSKLPNISTIFQAAYRERKLIEEREFEKLIISQMKERLKVNEVAKKDIQAKKDDQEPIRNNKKKKVIDMNIFMSRLIKLKEAEEAEKRAKAEENLQNSNPSTRLLSSKYEEFQSVQGKSTQISSQTHATEALKKHPSMETMMYKDPRLSKIMDAIDKEKDEWYYYIHQKMLRINQKGNIPNEAYEKLYRILQCCSFTTETIPFELVHALRMEVSSLLDDLLEQNFP
ncbi:DgyrCDS4480 [Dimorphilus gyrociliatus]|uniref:DgyrCDS4480 n=1 Tax=Dimorphilus gyrociliatus TaxID=2664684 RepID=A0A7I8VIJ7_9ANNE|nr:DgyrCDS4480 [Dimorphilus gyrociliatus]